LELGLGVKGFGLRVHNFVFSITSSRTRVEGKEFRVEGTGFGF
jgi:hypothetical protein